MQSKSIVYVLTIAVILALMVVMLGAYTRLTHAGLGCPDWPGCYGHLVLPNEGNELIKAQQFFPDIPVEAGKAWIEMAHRYAAGTLALLIFMIGGVVFWRRVHQAQIWALALMTLVLCQAALGMWTVTLKLLPVVVMSHLLGGILIFSLLCRLRLQLSDIRPVYLPTWRKWIGLGLVIVFCQIALGGWVSANYAGVACIGFPQCNGQWWPAMHFSEGFHLFSPVGANYQGGLLDNDIRVTIQMIHRLGALITALYSLGLSVLLWKHSANVMMRRMALVLSILVIIQLSLGILNVLYLLPITIAVAHNGVAALLMASMVIMLGLTQKRTHYASK